MDQRLLLQRLAMAAQVASSRICTLYSKTAVLISIVIFKKQAAKRTTSEKSNTFQNNSARPCPISTAAELSTEISSHTMCLSRVNIALRPSPATHPLSRAGPN